MTTLYFCQTVLYSLKITFHIYIQLKGILYEYYYKKTKSFSNIVKDICNSKTVKASLALTTLAGTAWAINKGYTETQLLKTGLSFTTVTLLATTSDVCKSSKKSVVFGIASFASAVSGIIFLNNLLLNTMISLPHHYDFSDKTKDYNTVMQQIANGKNKATKTNTITWYTGKGWNTETNTATTTAEVTSSQGSEITIKTKDIYGDTTFNTLMRDENGLFTVKNKEVIAVISPKEIRGKIQATFLHALAYFSPKTSDVNQELMSKIASGNDIATVRGVISEKERTEIITCTATVTKRIPTALQGVENITIKKTGSCGNEELSFIRDIHDNADSKRLRGLYTMETYNDYKHYTVETPLFYKSMKASLALLSILNGNSLK